MSILIGKTGGTIERQSEFRKGFTLIESFVAMTILLVAIVAPMTIAQRGLQSAFFARERTTAIFLAQEGIEIIRMRRDQNWLAGASVSNPSVDWLSGLTNCITSGSGNSNRKCGVHMLNNTIRNCRSLSCRLSAVDKRENAVRGLYFYSKSVGRLSPFTREVRISEEVDNEEAEVTVTVTWFSSFLRQNKSVVLSDRIFNRP